MQQWDDDGWFEAEAAAVEAALAAAAAARDGAVAAAGGAVSGPRTGLEAAPAQQQPIVAGPAQPQGQPVAAALAPAQHQPAVPPKPAQPQPQPPPPPQQQQRQAPQPQAPLQQRPPPQLPAAGGRCAVNVLLMLMPAPPTAPAALPRCRLEPAGGAQQAAMAQLNDVLKAKLPPTRRAWWDDPNKRGRSTWTVALPDSAELLAAAASGGANVQPSTMHVDRAAQLAASENLFVTDGGAVDALFDAIPRELRDTLFPFQRDGVRFALARHGRALIGDEMGLGKTLQAIALLAAYRSEWPALVMCPASLRDSWVSELERWLELPPGRARAVGGAHGDSPRALLAGGAEVLVASYNTLQGAVEGPHGLRACGFRVVVADESHMLKDDKTKRTQAALPLLRGAARAVLLSGTPALSRPSELFTQLSALCPALWPRFNEFAGRFCVSNVRFGGFANGCRSPEELSDLLRCMHLVRRLKKDVLTELPAKLRKRVFLDVPPSPNSTRIAAALDARRRRGGGDDAASKQLLNEFYVSSAEDKAAAVRAYLTDLASFSADDKFIFFAHHKVLLDAASAALAAAKVGAVRIDGDTAVAARAGLVERFQQAADCRAAVLSIKAAGVGLTLTEASLVVFGELSWTPGDIVQAEDRAHRIGQRSSVSVHFLHARGLVDDIMWETVEGKLAVLGQLMDGAAAAAGGLAAPPPPAVAPPPAGRAVAGVGGASTSQQRTLEGFGFCSQASQLRGGGGAGHPPAAPQPPPHQQQQQQQQQQQRAPAAGARPMPPAAAPGGAAAGGSARGGGSGGGAWAAPQPGAQRPQPAPLGGASLAAAAAAAPAQDEWGDWAEDNWA